MIKIISKLLCLFIIIAMVSGCAGKAGSPERAIITEAIATGALVGAAVGGVLGAVVGGEDGAAIGAITGTVLGGLTGKFIGDKQLAEYKDVKLSNDKLKSLLDEADKYNKSVKESNAALSTQIAELREAEKASKQDIETQLAMVDKKQKEVKEYIEERKKLSAILADDQRQKYEERIKTLEEEDKALEKALADLNSMKQGYIG